MIIARSVGQCHASLTEVHCGLSGKKKKPSSLQELYRCFSYDVHNTAKFTSAVFSKLNSTLTNHNKNIRLNVDASWIK